MKVVLAIFLSISTICLGEEVEVESFPKGFIIYQVVGNLEITTVVDNEFNIIEQVIIDLDTFEEVFIELLESGQYMKSQGNRTEIISEKFIDKLYL